MSLWLLATWEVSRPLRLLDTIVVSQGVYRDYINTIAHLIKSHFNELYHFQLLMNICSGFFSHFELMMMFDLVSIRHSPVSFC